MMIDSDYMEDPEGPSIDFPFKVPDEFLDYEEDEEEMNMMEEIGRISNFFGGGNVSENLEMKLQEFISYRIGHGDSISTAERRARRIKTLAKYLDVNRVDTG